MIVRNATNLIAGLKYKTRELSVIDKVIMHRISYPGAVTVFDIYREEENNAEVWKSLGGKFPYHFVIEASGIISQVVPLTYIAPHARKYNESSISVALVGDFRKEAPAKKAYDAAVMLVGWLRWSYGMVGDVDVFGHTELPDSSSYKNHICPGAKFDLAKFRADTDDLPLATIGILV